MKYIIGKTEDKEKPYSLASLHGGAKKKLGKYKTASDAHKALKKHRGL